MKIGFQGWFLNKPYTGIGQHCSGLTAALYKKNKDLCIVVPAETKVEDVPKNLVHVLKPKAWLIFAGLKKWYWERAQVPAFFAKKTLDWEYYPYPCPLPTASTHLRALTVHDLIGWKDKRYFGGKIKAYYHKQSRRSLVYADHIFTVSKTIHAELGIPSATVLYNAIPALPKRIAINSRYKNSLVYLGGYDIRKNVPALIEEFQKTQKLFPELKLVLIGSAHHKSKYYPEIPDVKDVIKLGALSNEKVYGALKSGFAFVHFSDSEGFNIPLLQAMSVGLPAIVPDIAVNREISSNTALFFDFSTKDKFASKIKLLQNPSERAKVIAAQKKAAHEFSWEKSVRSFLKALQQ